MKIALSIVTAAAVIGCILFGMAFMSAQSEADKVTAELETVQSQLTVAQAGLDSAGAALNAKDAELTQVQKDLTDSEANRDKITDELTATESELAKVKINLTDTTHQLDTAISLNTQMENDYTVLRQSIYGKTGSGEDGKMYITPDDPAVISKAREIAGAFSEEGNERWRDYKRLYDWVVNNIEYSSDTKIPLLPVSISGEITWFPEYWKTPAETLEDGRGDCEDMANLLASLMLAYNGGVYDVWLIKIQDNDSGHLAVGYPVTGDKLAILDPAGYYYSGTPSGYLQSAGISSAVNTWLAYWSDDMPGVAITAVFSTDFYKEFAGTQDFIDWAIVRYDD